MVEIGTRLGPYEILGSLGAGGMGEVYRARDTRLDRDVALKFVLDNVLADRERALRFEREAKTLAALNHPNIATLHGIEDAAGRRFLVMEVVGGETLAERVARYPAGLPPNEVLQIARQICDGLEAAHEKGIVHRDLKPANIKITPDDKVKILDFGLARIAESGNPSATNVAHSPTMSAMGTQAGVILGTASYMSPEQARGYTADHRSDIFSFGIVLYEMLTGRQPFPGETISDVLAAILAREPDLSAVPSHVTPRLGELLRRCLEKHPRKRWQAIGDVRYEIESLAADPRAGVQPVAPAEPIPPRRPPWRRAIPVVTTAAATALLLGVPLWTTRSSPSPAPVARFSVGLPSGQTIVAIGRGAIAISPDGRRLAYVANRQLYVRPLAELQGTRIVDNPARLALNNLAFSPDGGSIAYWSGGKIYRVAGLGGTPTALADADPMPTALAWRGEWLLYTSENRIWRLAAGGGRPEILIELSADEQANAADLLPDGRTVLYTVATGTALTRWDTARIYAQRPGDTRTLIHEGGSDGRYVESGHLVFVQRGVLFAMPFDPASLRTRGTALPVVEGVRRAGVQFPTTAHFSVSANGTLVYLAGPTEPALSPQLVLSTFDRSGTASVLKLPAGPYAEPRVSPNGRFIALTSDDGGEVAIWVHDLQAGGAPRRLTFGGRDRHPTFSADSRFVTFQSDRDGTPSIYRQLADGSGVAERLTTADNGRAHLPHSWSPDGAVLLYDDTDGKEFVLHALAVNEKRAVPFGDVRSIVPTGALFSPDGRRIAYSARKAGAPSTMVYVQPYPATGAMFQVSKLSEDGHHATWRTDGRELYYTPGPGALLIAVPVSTSPSFTLGEPVTLPRLFTNAAPEAPRTYDTLPQDRFLGLMGASRVDSASPSQVQFILNWFEELWEKVPLK